MKFFDTTIDTKSANRLVAEILLLVATPLIVFPFLGYTLASHNGLMIGLLPGTIAALLLGTFRKHIFIQRLHANTGDFLH